MPGSRFPASVAVVGIGATPQGRHPALTADDLAVDAIRSALVDAGIEKTDIDGLVTCKPMGGGGSDVAIGQMLGLNPAYSATLDYGTCNFSIHLAAMAIMAGLADTVALGYGTIQGTLFGDAGFAASITPDGTYGLLDPVAGMAALMFQRHRSRYGVTEDQLGAVAVAQSHWAALNPLAVRGRPLSIEDYLAAPYYVKPIRRFDVTPFDDGGAALIMTTIERAKDLARPPVLVLGIGEMTALRQNQIPQQIDRLWISKVADAVFGGAGLARGDIDIVSVQDPSSTWTMQMLELYGFVGPGEALPFIAEGHTGPGGVLPVNTSGGHLGESYMWGWLHTVELVRQLRGTAGQRQVPNAELAIHCSTMGHVKGAATIFGVQR